MLWAQGPDRLHEVPPTTSRSTARAALDCDGVTVAVLAGGLDVAYPSGHSALLHRIGQHGLLFTEYAPGVRPARYRFLTRNRLVAAMAGATVVVEAGLLGRVVAAVPGPVTSSASAGCHALLRNGAELITRAEHVVELIGHIGELAAEEPHPVTPLDGLGEAERRVYEALPGRGAATVEQWCAARTGAGGSCGPPRARPRHRRDSYSRRRVEVWTGGHVAGRPLQSFEVVRTEQLTPHMVRVVLRGKDFDAFVPSKFTDSYVKLAFVADDVDVAGLPQPLTLDSFAELPAEKKPSVRTLTVRHVDAASRQIALDVVVHGEHGIAGQWAATAQPGQPIYLMGPGGAYTPDPAADWHLLAGDESIAAALEALPPSAVGKAFIEVAGHEDEIPLTAPDGVEVHWVYRGGRADLVPEDRAGDHAPLIEAVTSAPWLPGQVHVFIHGEAQAVMHNLRPYVRKERGVDAKWAASISGYWRRGRTEETFRQWKKELAQAESAQA